MADIKVFSSAFCPYCLAAKQLLTSIGASFEEISVDQDPELRQQMAEQYSWRTVPMIIIDGELIGGFDELMKLHQAGTLQPLLSAL